MKLTQKQINICLLILTVLAAIKMLFEPFSHDEEYQFLISYRQLMGDTLIETIWEPHQTSAFLCTLFLAPYYLLTGTFTGAVLYLRVMGTLLHLAVSYYLYRIFRHFLDKAPAYLLGLLFFNTVPKLIMLPEFGGMQVWFGVLCFLLLIDSAEDITLTHTGTAAVRTSLKLVAAALCLCLNVLSYPSCVFLFIPFLVMVWRHSPAANRITRTAVFALTCIISGVVYTAYYVFLNLGLEIFLRNISAILTSDVTHNFDTLSKLGGILQNLLLYGVLFALLTLLAFGIIRIPAIKRKLPQQTSVSLIGMVLFLSNLIQLILWVLFNTGYEFLQLHLAVSLCLGFWMLRLMRPAADTFSSYMWFGAVIGGLSLACVMMLTDLNLLSSVPHAMLGCICMLALFAYTVREHTGFVRALLLFCCLTACVGKGYTLRGGMNYNNILQSENICKYGPAIGTVSNYMGAYIYNDEYLLWQEAIPENSKVLVVTDNVQSTNTIQYTFRNAEVCHYSVVNPTAYDERLLTYWSYYPEKEPDIIVIDCWFGSMLFPADSWIIRYIEQDFGYTEVIEGNYVRIYKK